MKKRKGYTFTVDEEISQFLEELKARNVVLSSYIEDLIREDMVHRAERQIQKKQHKKEKNRTLSINFIEYKSMKLDLSKYNKAQFQSITSKKTS